jgi:homoserine kinase
VKRLRIEAPATSANLGPGFDTLGLALDIVDVVNVELDPDGGDVLLCEENAEQALDSRDNLLCRAYSRWASGREINLPGARFTVERRIPISKGLGSSAANIVAGLAAAAWAERDVKGEAKAAPGAAATRAKAAEERILRLAAILEGHADNTSAAVLGGMTAAFLEGETVRVLHVANHLALGVALYIPDAPLLTRDARAALPEKVSMEDAIFNLGRLAYLTTALIWGRWDQIGPAMEDRLHQPCRARLIPALTEVIKAAREAGAYGAALSGGGPSVIALGPMESAEAVAAAMEARAHQLDWAGKSVVSQVRDIGVQVKEITE